MLILTEHRIFSYPCYELPPPNGEDYVLKSVCLFFRLLDYSKSYQRILMKFLEGCGV